MKTVCSREIEAKNALEKILRACVEDVKSEIQKKKQGGGVFGAGATQQRWKKGGEEGLSQAEKDKIIEVLLS